MAVSFGGDAISLSVTPASSPDPSCRTTKWPKSNLVACPGLAACAHMSKGINHLDYARVFAELQRQGDQAAGVATDEITDFGLCEVIVCGFIRRRVGRGAIRHAIAREGLGGEAGVDRAVSHHGTLSNYRNADGKTPFSLPCVTSDGSHQYVLKASLLSQYISSKS